jgi:hypothetical protein
MTASGFGGDPLAGFEPPCDPVADSVAQVRYVITNTVCRNSSPILHDKFWLVPLLL